MLTLITGVYPGANRQYNVDMYKTGVFLVIFGVTWASMLLAAEEPPSQVPGFNERLNQALGSEGGVQVYKDPAGNVGTILDPPGGERRITVQPPQSPSMNLGPPLQLHNQPLQLPQAMPPTHPPAPDFPQKAR
ncbi:MAG: hypothetical protein E8D41_09785 [Nitrospira sp.]|nr:MAG: hypothetical protein E8D41_09785 [Nitrospira sp.]